MTKKQRMLTAMTGGTPDRVPCSPDANWMIPAKMTGKPFWEVFRDNNPPIWKAYNDSVRYFGVDGFSHHGIYEIPPRKDVEYEEKIISKTDERLIVETIFRCPAGEMNQQTTYFHNDAQAETKKFIDDFDAQFECVKYLLFGDVEKIKFDKYQEARADMGDDGVVGLCMNLPTLFTWWREPMSAAFLDYYDYHDKVSELVEEWADYLIKIAEKIIEQNVNPDFVFFPNSGLITMQSVDIMREYSLPSLIKLTKMFKDAGIVTSLHSCGKERALVEAAALETDLDCIDPLEIAPMGDCDLREIKEKFGDKIALKGNLHTTEVMLKMDADGVEKAAREVLEIGMPGGGFILSTGDQCGRDTPEENIFKLVEVCEKYGKY